MIYCESMYNILRSDDLPGPLMYEERSGSLLIRLYNEYYPPLRIMTLVERKWTSLF